MNQKEYEERMKDPKYKELEITNCDSGKEYVFISYRGDSWKKVLTDIVYRLQKQYHLRIYFDKEFASGTNVWIDQFIRNMDSKNCKAVLCFFDEGYVTSYATLLELMHAMNPKSKLKKSIYAINFPINWKKLDEDDHHTGLGLESQKNPAWEKEFEAFKYEFNLLKKNKEYNGIEAYFYIRNDNSSSELRACDCKDIMAILQPKNKRDYVDTEEFYEQFIIDPLRKAFPGVFSEIQYKVRLINGNEVHEKLVDLGEKIDIPRIKEKEGQKFSGWIYSVDGKEKEWNFDSDIVKSDIELSAKWKTMGSTHDISENTTLKEFQQYCEDIDFTLKLRKEREKSKKQLFDYLMASLLRGCDKNPGNEKKILDCARYNYCTYVISAKLDLKNPEIGASWYTWTSNSRKALKKEDMPENFFSSDGRVKSGFLGDNSKIFESLDENMTIGEVLKKYELKEKGFDTKDNEGIINAWNLIKDMNVNSQAQ